MGDITKGVGGRFKATSEFTATGYGKGHHTIKVTDTQTGDFRTDYFWPEHGGEETSKDVVAKRLAADILATQKASLEDDESGWRFDLGTEPEITDGDPK